MYKRIFESKKHTFKKYSELEDTMIILEGFKVLRGAKLPKKTDSIEEQRHDIDIIRTALAHKQYKLLKNVGSFKELEICQKMMFR